MSYLSDLLGASYKEGMSEEEISAALEKANKQSTSENDKLKAMLTKANSEAAEYKKQLRGKQTEEEAAAAAQKEAIDKLIAENNELRKSMDIANKTAKLTAQGYSEELAKSTAQAMLDGDFDTVLSNQSKYLESAKQSIKQELMNSTPRPRASTATDNSLDYSKLIEEARSKGNISEVAYYTRLQQSNLQTDDVK